MPKGELRPFLFCCFLVLEADSGNLFSRWEAFGSGVLGGPEIPEVPGSRGSGVRLDRGSWRPPGGSGAPFVFVVVLRGSSLKDSLPLLKGELRPFRGEQRPND
jgi:hypothetical protein